MLDSRKFSVEEICRVFGIPPHMIGHTQNSTSWGTGLEQQTLGFQKFTLRRRLEADRASVRKAVDPAGSPGRSSRSSSILKGCFAATVLPAAPFTRPAFWNGWMTINEVRALENLPPVEGGEVPRMQMQNVPITEAGQAQLPAPAA